MQTNCLDLLAAHAHVVGCYLPSDHQPFDCRNPCLINYSVFQKFHGRKKGGPFVRGFSAKPGLPSPAVSMCATSASTPSASMTAASNSSQTDSRRSAVCCRQYCCVLSRCRWSCAPAPAAVPSRRSSPCTQGPNKTPRTGVPRPLPNSLWWARVAQPLRPTTTAAAASRWSALLAFSAARAFGASLLGCSPTGAASVDGAQRRLSEVIASTHLDDVLVLPVVFNRAKELQPGTRAWRTLTFLIIHSVAPDIHDGRYVQYLTMFLISCGSFRVSMLDLTSLALRCNFDLT